MQHHRFSLVALATLLAISASAQTAKRPINHHDYDSWRTISGQRLTNDGKFLAYSLFPQEGDGEVVIRNLVTGQETRIPAGMRPPPAPRRLKKRKLRRRRAGGDHRVLRRQQHCGVRTFPSKAETTQAKKEKKSPRQMPKTAW